MVAIVMMEFIMVKLNCWVFMPQFQKVNVIVNNGNIYEGVESVLFKKGYRVIFEKVLDNILERKWLKKNKRYGDKVHLTRAPIINEK